MNAYWYIQPITHDADTSQRMTYAVRELGLEVSNQEYAPFGAMDWSFLPVASKRPVVFLGSINALKSYQRHAEQLHKVDRCGVLPFAWCDWDVLSCHHYYTHLGKHLLSQNYAFYPMTELRRLKDKIWFKFTSHCDSKVFIRPDTNDKIFSGEVVDYKNFDSFWDRVTWDKPADDLLCVVASPEQIVAEYRVVVADGKAITAGQYREDGGILVQPCSLPGVLEFAEKVAADWTPHPIFCLDVARTVEDLALIEIGSVNVAGFYGCDMKVIAEAMSRIAQREWDESYGEEC